MFERFGQLILLGLGVIRSARRLRTEGSQILMTTIGFLHFVQRWDARPLLP
jgi:hypothetical protein